MSKSLSRVMVALSEAGLKISPVEMTLSTRTAAEAAEAIGCDIDQIAKSVVFSADPSEVVLFITAGGSTVDPDKASALAGRRLTRATAPQIRTQTGFAIGGVSPIGLIKPVRSFFDPRLAEFDQVWPAAGTPRHVFPINPADLLHLSKAQIADFTVNS